MKRVLIAAAAIVIAGTATVAEARQGCGIGFHRGPRGHCIANRAGVFYGGRGWWDGHRYRQHRYRWHGGWRYR